MKIGVIGGGQLGRMLALAGTPLGMKFVFLDPAQDACAAALGEHIRADYHDHEHLRQLADQVDLVTFEFESVPADTVAFLSQFVPVFPSAESLRIARDRLLEKNLFRSLDIPVAPYAAIDSQADLEQAAASIGLPAVLKTRTLGYDGKGQKVLRSSADVSRAFAELGSVPCILEDFVEFSGEVSLIAVRGRDGASKCYPLVHNTHNEGVLRVSIASDQHPLQA
ncbi:MAG: ATP-grasp domain-containing protein, partial [Pseudohongiella sp.]